MLFKSIKISLIGLAGLALIGMLLFGGDLVSYARSSAASVRSSVKESVPIEFELERARQLLDEIVPEMQANIRLIAQEEVEVANLKRDIAESARAAAEEKARLRKLSAQLEAGTEQCVIGERRYNRREIKDELARRFERFKEAEIVLAGKRKLLAARERSLQAAVEMLEKARTQKAVLSSRIETLAGKQRLLKASAIGSNVQVDNSKLAQTEKLLGDIQKRLDVAERVLAHEGRFVDPIDVDVVDEADLLRQVAEHINDDDRALAATPAPQNR